MISLNHSLQIIIHHNIPTTMSVEKIIFISSSISTMSTMSIEKIIFINPLNIQLSHDDNQIRKYLQKYVNISTFLIENK